MDFWLDGPIFRPELRRIEETLSRNPEESIDRLFEDWPLPLYAQLYVSDLAAYPAISARLPKSLEEAKQIQCNGSSGALALQQAVSFVQSMSAAYRKYTGKDIRNAAALDYAVGWGRILRIAMREIPETQLTGCDAWSSAVEKAKSLGFKCDIVQVPMRPEALPFRAGQFDLVWISSLFTHLTADFGNAILRALHPTMARNGMVAMTIWTPECFPQSHPIRQQAGDFAWVPIEGVDPRFGYGDATLTPDYVRREWTDWKLLGIDIIANDPKQFILFLQPR